MKKAFILSLAVTIISFAGFSQSFNKEKLDSYFDALASNNRFMGSVAIAQRGKLIYSKSVGFIDTEQALEANKNSKYRIGSISKTDNQLFGQGTGQSSFPLEATEKDKFEFKQAGVVLEFNPTNKTMILKQGGGTFKFERE